MRNVVCAFFRWLAGRFLPVRFKRALFVLAVNVKLANMRVLTDPTVDKLNAKLNLVQYSDVLEVMQDRLGDRLLDGEKVDGFIVNNHDALCRGMFCSTDDIIQRTAKSFVNAAPWWLNYGTENMERDVSGVILPSKAESAIPR